LSLQTSPSGPNPERLLVMLKDDLGDLQKNSSSHFHLYIILL